MNYKKTVCGLLLCISMQITTASLTKVSYKIIDVAKLTTLLTSKGYKIISTEKGKFEAKKEYPVQKFLKNDFEFMIKNVDVCKISQLRGDDFFVEVGKESSLKVFNKNEDELAFDEEEENDLLEECCDSNKRTAYVLTHQRALDLAYAFLKLKK